MDPGIEVDWWRWVTLGYAKNCAGFWVHQKQMVAWTMRYEMVTKGKKQDEAMQKAERQPAPRFSTGLLPSALPRMSSAGHKWTGSLSFTFSFAEETGGPGPEVATCSGTENFIRKTPWEWVTEKPLSLVRNNYGKDGNKTNAFRLKAVLLWTLQGRKIALPLKFWLHTFYWLILGKHMHCHNAHVEVSEGRGSLLPPWRIQG